MKKALLFLSFGLATSVIALACSSSDRPAASTSGGLSASGGVSTPTDAGEDVVDAEAGLPRENDALCMGLTEPTRVLGEYSEPSTAPTPYGGTIVAGEYELDELDEYDPNGGVDGGEGAIEGLSGKSGSGTLTITANTMVFNDAYGPDDSVPTPAARGYAYSFSGTTIFAAQVCPTVATTVEIPFSVSGSSISLFTDATHRVVYRAK